MLSFSADGTVTIRILTDGITVSSTDWPGLNWPGLSPAIGVDGKTLCGRMADARKVGDEIHIRWTFEGCALIVTTRISRQETWAIFESELKNDGQSPVKLESIAVLTAHQPADAPEWFGPLNRLRVYEQNTTSGTVRWADESANASGQPLEAMGNLQSKSQSNLVWMAYGVEPGAALLAGFRGSERWRGDFDFAADGQSGQTWKAGYDTNGYELKAGESVTLDSLALGVSRDPWALLEAYGELTKRDADPRRLDHSPVTFCSWYPFRLGVTEESILANAQVGARRLKGHGLKVMQIDLGWEDGCIPGSIRESDRFGRGLRWLADRLESMGLALGLWMAPYCILDNDPLASEHPEWLMRDAAGQPIEHGRWFWEPHGKIFLLDLAQPAVQAHLHRTIAEMVRRGMRYLKADFIGMVRNELGRIGAAVTRAALDTDGSNPAWYLSCGGPDIPGPGRPDLLYACMDTGNTGYVAWHTLRSIFTSVACHLFKHRRWGIIQPSCMCVGLPGTLGEARARATMAFLCGGEIDIGDDLTKLPEDRWRVLLATVPPLGITAKVIDLFDPLPMLTVDYAGSTQTQSLAIRPAEDRPSIAARVWNLQVKKDQDAWNAVGVFDYGPSSAKESDKYASVPITILDLPLTKLGLRPDGDYWVHEFWSGQSVRTPNVTAAPSGYQHPGDQQQLVLRRPDGILRVQFFGPDVKLLIIREHRPHPWVLASTFHQSGGAEFSNVQWNPADRTLTGRLNRGPGEAGTIYITTETEPTAVTIGNHPTPVRPHTTGVYAFDVICPATETTWTARF